MGEGGGGERQREREREREGLTDFAIQESERVFFLFCSFLFCTFFFLCSHLLPTYLFFFAEDPISFCLVSHLLLSGLLLLFFSPHKRVSRV